MFKIAPMSQATVERPVTVNMDMSWHVHITGKLATNSKLFEGFPHHLKEKDQLHKILHCLE